MTPAGERSRPSFYATLSLVVAVATCVAAWFMVPEFRKMFGFESQGQKPVTTINGSEQIKNSAPSTPPDTAQRSGIQRSSGSLASSSDLPSSRPKPKPYMTKAPDAIIVGDFSFAMTECTHSTTEYIGVIKVLNCEGVVQNETDQKVQITFTNGSAVDDRGNQYLLSRGPYYLGFPGILFIGSANVEQELMPHLPLKFGYQMQRCPTTYSGCRLRCGLQKNPMDCPGSK